MKQHIWDTVAGHIPSIYLTAVFQKFYLVHSWILCPTCNPSFLGFSVSVSLCLCIFSSLIFQNFWLYILSVAANIVSISVIQTDDFWFYAIYDFKSHLTHEQKTSVQRRPKCWERSVKRMPNLNFISVKLQKQPPRGVLKKRCSEIMQKFTGEHTCRRAISIKLQSNFVEIALRHGCSPVNLLHIFRTPFQRTPLEGCFCKLYFVSV